VFHSYTMSDSSDPEVELYEETIGGLNWDEPVSTGMSGMVPVASAPTIGTILHDPTIIIDSRGHSVDTTDLFAHAPWPDPRDHPDELAEAIKEEPRYGVAATLAPNVGRGVSRYPNCRSRGCSSRRVTPR